MKFERYQPDLDAYVRRVRSGSCFVCAILARDPAFADHHIIYEDEDAIVFLAMNPRQYGYTLVAPKQHREQVVGDFTVEEYLGLQRIVHRVAEAVREEVGAERVYPGSSASLMTTPGWSTRRLPRVGIRSASPMGSRSS